MASAVSGLGSKADRARHLILMGLRGSGKTTLGRLIGEHAGCPFVDLDDQTTALLGFSSLREAWDSVGDVAFRKVEVQALGEQLNQGKDAQRVLALGGGSPTAPGAADLLREATTSGDVTLVYLRGTPRTLRDRLRSAENMDRPSLTGAGVLEEIEDVFTARDKLYRSLADHVAEIDGLSVEELLNEILKLWPLA